MPKQLTKPPPSSSVAGMLQPNVGAQVLAKPEVVALPILPVPVQPMPAALNANLDRMPASGEVPDVPRQFTLTRKADRTLKRLVTTYGDATGIDLKHSELLRAIMMAVEHAMPQLEREARGIGMLKRPKNDRGREAEREDLERRIAAAFVAGMRAAGMMDSGRR